MSNRSGSSKAAGSRLAANDMVVTVSPRRHRHAEQIQGFGGIAPRPQHRRLEAEDLVHRLCSQARIAG